MTTQGAADHKVDDNLLGSFCTDNYVRMLVFGKGGA